MSSAKHDWETPDSVLNIVRSFCRHGIELDVCTGDHNPTGAERFYTETTDGLSQEWGELKVGHLLWMNPPYGRQVGVWMKKWVSFEPKFAHALALVAARTSNGWFQDALEKSNAVCFIRGRLAFRGANSCAPFPSAIFYRGCDPVRFREVFSKLGAVKL